MSSRRDHLKQLGTLFLLGCGSSATRAIPSLTRGPFFVDTIDDPNLTAGGMPPPGMGPPHGPHDPRGPHRGPPPGGFDHPPGPPPNLKMIDPHIPARADLRVSSRGDTRVQPGLPLTLALHVRDAARGTPLAGARVDLWHCSARGVYSDVEVGMNDGGADHTGEDFLRGYQLADARGTVTFTTIYPGWYEGRTVHIHLKVRQLAADGTIPTEATSQLFFPDDVSDHVFASSPAYANTAARQRNADDDIFRRAGGALVLAPRPAGAGYVASIDLPVTVGATFGG
jgi:protocatechuate 3,4-dioxygenase beta subunit